MEDNKLLATLDSLPKVSRVLERGLTRAAAAVRCLSEGASSVCGGADAQTQPVYQRRSGHGGLVTILLSFGLLMLLWSDIWSFINGERAYTFAVDDLLGKTMQINLDMTVAMPCESAWTRQGAADRADLSLDIKDAVGDRIMLGPNRIARDGTVFKRRHEHEVGCVRPRWRS